MRGERVWELAVSLIGCFWRALTRENGTGGLGRKRDSYGVLASRTDP